MTPPAAEAALLWAPRAWVGGRWREAVLLRTDAQGHWAELRCDTPPPPQARRLPGPALPGLVDAHSHAFQRAFAGLAEQRSGEHDDFWSWRDRMYGVALRITPPQLRAIAALLYAELLAGGYTQVCEFHYLHHAPDGRPYEDALAMSRALAEAAADAGIGLTLLPVLYERAGFTQPALRDDQRRFATAVPQLLAWRREIRGWGLPRVDAGVAVHSLRAALPASMQALLEGLAGEDAPIHVHVAEQTAEVDDCLAATGCRPIEWLARSLPLDARWQLVHATHATPAEIEAVARSGAGVVICPTTEANLGDGLPDLPRWLDAGVPLAVGSDSQVGRNWPEELRWLEYAQRLVLRRRNVAADPAQGQPSTAARLFERTLQSGAAAAGLGRGGLEPGARADLLVVDEAASGIAGLPAAQALDALLFGGGAPVFAEVHVGSRRVEAGRADLAQRGRQALAELWQDAPG